ncbi:MAG: S-methyl-5-thioribose-1-phosphate isomerase, partial [Candidatus Dadabacteria bacterium]
MSVRPIEWTGEALRLLDQRRLPTEEIVHTYTDAEAVARAIEDMVV